MLTSKYQRHHTLRYHGTFDNDKQLWKESLNIDGLWRDRHKNVAGLNQLCSFSNVFCEKESSYIYDSLTPFYHLLTFHDMYSCHSTLIHTDSESVFFQLFTCLEELMSQSSHTRGVHTNQYTTLAILSKPFACNQRVIYNHLT